MATDTPTAAATIQPYRLSVGQYLVMIGAGVFPESARVELLDGILVRKMTKYPPHNYCVSQLASILRTSLPAPWIVSEEKPIDLGRRWCPEPDIAVVKGPLDRYRARFMTVADLGFVAEVAESSYSQDRGLKWRGYASAGVSIYWIINLAKTQVEVYNDPTGKGRSASYGSIVIHGIDATVPVVLDGQEVGRIAVRDILP